MVKQLGNDINAVAILSFTVMIIDYMYTHRNQSKGGWSIKGIIQDDNPDTKVSCVSTHLTSFSVLVSTRARAGNEVCVCLCMCAKPCLCKISKLTFLQ